MIQFAGGCQIDPTKAGLVHGISFDLVFLLRVQLGCALLLLFVGGMLLLLLIDDNRHGLSMLDAMYVVDELLHLNHIYRFHHQSI